MLKATSEQLNVIESLARITTMTRSISQSDCDFCRREIREHMYLESTRFVVIYNVAPILPGHSLVIPKEHVESLLELTDDEMLEFVRLSRAAVEILLLVFGSTGFNWTIQEGEEAGQTIPHLHMHLIPRSVGDLAEPGDWYSRLKESGGGRIDSVDRKRLSEDEMKHVVAKLKSAASAEEFDSMRQFGIIVPSWQ